MPGTFVHQIPLPPEGRRLLDALPGLFGSKAERTELGLEWAILSRVPENPRHPFKPQLHVHLDRDYRANYTPGHLGSMLLAALRTYHERTANGRSYVPPPGVWYTGLDLPSATLEALRRRSFQSGTHPEKELGDAFVRALQGLRSFHGGFPVITTRHVDVPLAPETQRLYKAEGDRAADLGLDIDTLLVEWIARNEGRPAP